MGGFLEQKGMLVIFTAANDDSLTDFMSSKI